MVLTLLRAGRRWALHRWPRRCSAGACLEQWCSMCGDDGWEGCSTYLLASMPTQRVSLPLGAAARAHLLHSAPLPLVAVSHPRH